MKYRISDICTINESTLSKRDSIQDILYLDTANLTENTIGELQKYKVSEAPSRAQRKVRNNTIVYSSVRPRLCHYGIMENPASNVIVSTGFITLDVINKDIIDPYFLYYKLTEKRLTEYIGTIADTNVSSYPSINPSDLGNITIEFPNILEQRRISLLFRNLEKKIALNKQINCDLEAMAKQLYDYWFVQFDFPNDEGKPYKSSGGKMVWNETLKREIPEGWINAQLIDIANITMGQSPDGSSYNEEGNGVIFYQGSTDFGMRFPSVRQYTTAPTRFAKKGDILMSVRAPVGAVNIANNACCIGRGLAALNSKLGSLTHLYYIINDLKVAFEQRNAAGTTFGSITKEDLYTLPIVRPADCIVKRFEQICHPIFEKQMIIGEQNNDLIKQRDKLLPLLMNGQVTIKQ